MKQHKDKPKRKAPIRKSDNLPTATKHGVDSQAIQLRFTDMRTKEAQQLHGIMQAIRKELGETNGFQDVILTMIRAKTIVVILLGQWIEENKSVVHPNGEVPRVIDVLRSYTKSIEDSLKELKLHSTQALERLPSIQDLVESAQVKA